ncbi:uncharacterized protein (DUF2342 family) [Rhodopseudomonas rhenobacensis]|uniref:Uncharacterized protein (DUF2342 family) n=1 Tax=Rhodopseudomonas rhenobacensis TaxID=87461 RepID=A0A7W7Z1S0_9BRAD|nr:uncharacterized protein (DUF2342 family) [Rhodopseudomonas rhenobacensis]
MMTSKATRRIHLLLAAVGGMAASMQTASAIEQVPREQDIIELRLGQRIQVDDGSCPTGQIKEILGATLTASGVTRTRSCVPRFGTKKK